jgi:raffinose/stachyose/melibiose transport system substrate-binding protein
MFSRISKRGIGATAAVAVSALILSGCASETADPGPTNGETTNPVTITVLHDDLATTLTYMEELIAGFEDANPGITVETETRPGGSDGDNLVKTKLATGEMSDVFLYNSGSLLQALNPDQNLVDLSGEAWMSNVIDSFLPTVSTANGTYGVPYGTAMGGGIMYNKKVYADLGLTVPTTWAEFMANNDKIKAAGIAPVIQTYGDSWTSQLFVLADFHNVLQDAPDFAEEYTNNVAKYASTPAAMRGFEYLEELHKGRYFNTDYASALFPEGVLKLANGEGAHYPMLTFAVATVQDVAADKINDIGFFAQPGPDAATNGLTVWMPAGAYIPQTTTGDKLVAAKKFLEYMISAEGIQAYIDTNGQTGPFLVANAPSAADLLPAYQDMFPYFERDGGTSPALEFVSPIKGPSLEQITVATGTGQYTAKRAAELYDEDVKKQAQQLGIPGW